MLKVSEFAGLAGVSMRLLRHYDHLGLFKPAYIDPDTSYRYYTLDQLPRFNQILALKDLGIALDEIPALLDTETGVMHTLLQRKQSELQTLKLQTEERLRRVEMNLAALEQSGQVLNVVLKKTPAWFTLSVTQRLAPGESIIPVFQQMQRALVKAERAMSIFHVFCDDAPERVIEVAYLFDKPVTERPVLENGQVVQAGMIPAFDLVASVIEAKPHHARHYTICQLCEWVTVHGYEMAAPAREIYLRRNSTPAGENFITEIQVPLRRTS